MRWAYYFIGGKIRKVAVVQAREISSSHDFDMFIDEARDKLGWPLKVEYREGEVWAYRADEDEKEGSS